MPVELSLLEKRASGEELKRPFVWSLRQFSCGGNRSRLPPCPEKKQNSTIERSGHKKAKQTAWFSMGYRLVTFVPVLPTFKLFTGWKNSARKSNCEVSEWSKPTCG